MCWLQVMNTFDGMSSYMYTYSCTYVLVLSVNLNNVINTLVVSREWIFLLIMFMKKGGFGALTSLSVTGGISVR